MTEYTVWISPQGRRFLNRFPENRRLAIIKKEFKIPIFSKVTIHYNWDGVEQ